MTEINKSKLERILLKVQKPGRYTGGELNQTVKDWNQVRTKVALVFPDIYDLGMSNLGLAILYDLLNQQDDVLAERAYLPWLDMESEMRSAGIPLYSLENKRPLREFDIIGISLPYETLYTNTLNVLDLAGIPLFSSDRSTFDPLVIAGGHATFNPEPLYRFIDAFVIGEGEEVIHEIVNVYQEWKQNLNSRRDLLLALARIEGVYIPSFYEPKYEPDGTIRQIDRLIPEAPYPIVKRIVAKLPPPPTRFIVPYIDTVHNRVPIEIMRGCTRGCRFCHAGMVTRPVRERSVDEIVDAIERSIAATGFEEVGLLSLSSSDYTHVVDLVRAVSDKFKDRQLTISLPSLRIETVSVELMDALPADRRSGFTLAPEAATERMRQIINKPVSTSQLLETAREIYRRGWPTIKLYFMIGHPSETLEDVRAIVDLCKAVLREGHKTIGRRAKLHAGVSTFVPKPHTPFQWVACDTIESINQKLDFLKRHLRGDGLKLTWTQPEVTLVEAWLSRGDRRLADVIYHAWKLGAKFDAWKDQLNFNAWTEAFRIVGLDPAFYTHRPRAYDEVFPWDHISTAVRKSFLLQDLHRSENAIPLNDCRNQCYACGILPTFADLRRENPGDAWKCPEVSKRGQKATKTIIINIPV